MNRAIWQESIFFGDNVRLLFLKTLKKAWRDLRHTGLAGSYLLPDEQSPSPRGGDALAWAEGSLMKRVDLYPDPGPERKRPVC